ncbi:MAG: hypothetical protein HY914_05595 [Desulfomonile tiedjei]|nr:hypothetical protein [Desulfomonile tiedjei]
MSSPRLHVYVALLVVLVNAISLLPVLESPYLGDDAWCESTLRGLCLLSKMSLGEVCWNTVVDYIHSGRWYPLVVYYFPVFYYLDQYLYKAATVLFVVANIVLFGYFVRLVTGSRSWALMAALLPPLFIQLRSYHDPVMSYYFLMQVEFSLILASLILLVHYLRSPRPVFLGLSIASWAGCLLVYEAFYAFWIMHGVVAYLHFGRRALRKVAATTAPFFLVAVVNLGIMLFVRAEFAPHYEGTSLNFAPQAWLWAFLKQAFAAVPLSYFAAFESWAAEVEFARSYFANDVAVMCVAWAILWLLASDCSRLGGRDRRHDAIKALLVLGTGFWLLPALIVTLSAKYQRELQWGLGYLPVYVSSFGLMMVALAAIAAAYQGAGRFSGAVRQLVVVVIVAAGIVVCGINYMTNRTVIHEYNYAEHFHRKLLEDALHSDLMRFVPQGSYVLCGYPLRSWNTPAFFRMHAGLTLQMVQPAGFSPDRKLGNMLVEEAFSEYRKPGSTHHYRFSTGSHLCSEFLGYKAEFVASEGPVLRRMVGSKPTVQRRQAFFLQYAGQFKGAGYAVLGRVADLEADNQKIEGVAVDRLWVYTGIPVGYPYHDICVSGRWTNCRTLKQAGAFRFTEKDMRVVRSYPEGKLFEIPMRPSWKFIDAKSLMVHLTFTDASLSHFTEVFPGSHASLRPH